MVHKSDNKLGPDIFATNSECGRQEMISAIMNKIRK